VRPCVAADKANITECLIDKVAAFNASVQELAVDVINAYATAAVQFYASVGGHRRELITFTFDSSTALTFDNYMNTSLFPVYQDWWCHRAETVFDNAGSCIKPCLDADEQSLLGVTLLTTWCDRDLIGHAVVAAGDYDIRQSVNASAFAGMNGVFVSAYLEYQVSISQPAIPPFSRFWKIGGSFANSTRDDILAYYSCPATCNQLVQQAMDTQNGGQGIVTDDGNVSAASAVGLGAWAAALAATAAWVSAA